jgi:hypothetical protein
MATQDLFNIVAVDDFNMGAMENKSLNIFNSRLVLADPDSATDTDYARIEGVVGHEYFHNWTGGADPQTLCVRVGVSGDGGEGTAARQDLDQEARAPMQAHAVFLNNAQASCIGLTAPGDMSCLYHDLQANFGYAPTAAVAAAAAGNRVTCRDWFQLTLKEGLTVFRDQGFSADMNSAAVKRIEVRTVLNLIGLCLHES